MEHTIADRPGGEDLRLVAEVRPQRRKCHGARNQLQIRRGEEQLLRLVGEDRFAGVE